MSKSPRRIGFLLLALIAEAVGACVGDSPSTAPTDAGSSSDGSIDSTVPADASTDGGPSFGPTTFGSRLVVWFDPTSAINSAGKMTKWTDRSGSNNDAVQPIAQNAPVFTDAGSLGSVRFNPSLDAGAEYLVIPDSVSLHWGTGDYTIGVVVKHTNALGTYGAIWTKSTDSSGSCPCNGLALFANFKTPIPTTAFAAQVAGLPGDASTQVLSLDAGYDDDRFHAVVVRRTGQTTLEIRVDGIVAKNTSVVSVDESADGATVGIGAGATGFAGNVGTSQLLHGNIAEMVAVSGTVSDVEIQSLESYFKARYGL